MFWRICRLLGRIFAEAGTRPIRAVEIEAVSINVFLMQCSKCQMSDKRLMFAETPPCKKCGMSLKSEDTLNVDGSHTVIEANDSAHSPIERCQVVNAEETVTRASELNNEEAELRVVIETADDDAIKDDIILQDALVSSNDKLHIEQVCKAHKGAKRYSCPCSFSFAGAIEPRGSNAFGCSC